MNSGLALSNYGTIEGDITYTADYNLIIRVFGGWQVSIMYENGSGLTVITNDATNTVRMMSIFIPQGIKYRLNQMQGYQSQGAPGRLVLKNI